MDILDLEKMAGIDPDSVMLLDLAEVSQNKLSEEVIKPLQS